MRHTGAKRDAALMLAESGWPVDKIAAAVAADPHAVARWLAGGQLHRASRPRMHDACSICGGADLRNNGLCGRCTEAKWEAARDMKASGVSVPDIARALESTPGAVARGLAGRENTIGDHIGPVAA